jgi:cytochrome o ubiquinol oxidase subunit II
LQADEPGTFEGLSAQFSGDGFSDMRFDVVAVDAEAFKNWVSATKTQGTVLDSDAFAELVKPGKAGTAQVFAEVTEGLFDRISMSHMTAVSPQREQ